MLYLDSSALAKLFAPEAESDALRARLDSYEGRWVTSTLTEIELTRAVARAKPSALAHVPGVLARCDRLDIDDRVRADAAVLIPPELRTLDAIHLATALELESELEALITYDKRLAQAAQAASLTVESPA